MFSSKSYVRNACHIGFDPCVRRPALVARRAALAACACAARHSPPAAGRWPPLAAAPALAGRPPLPGVCSLRSSLTAVAIAMQSPSADRLFCFNLASAKPMVQSFCQATSMCLWRDTSPAGGEEQLWRPKHMLWA